ncbi:MAG: tryptophan--tRNA ligase [Promethearchaeota archaeon]|jgi:tryptophanyl-tRNA synthetase
MPDNFKIDPWGSSALQDEDYTRLIKEFGITEITESLRQKMIQNRFIRRKIIFGHRELNLVFKAIENGQPWSVMSGIKPSGPFHLGTSTTALEIIEFQKMGAKAYYCIADIESWEDNGIPWEDADETAIDNLADILALGLDPSPEKAYIWRQSSETKVHEVAFKVSRLVTNSMMKAIYGEKEFGLYMSALIQVGDIVLPQVIEGSQPTIVPVGIDQDPHIRLTRDLTRRFYKKFFLPGATYHYLLAGIDGADKMAKRNPNSSFSFNEPPKEVARKVKGALTGGRKNKEEQIKLGGEPQKCMIYKMLMYHFEEDDEKLAKDFERCVKGELLCGDHKSECVEKVLNFIENHQKKKEKLIDKSRELLNLN